MWDWAPPRKTIGPAEVVVADAWGRTQATRIAGLLHWQRALVLDSLQKNPSVLACPCELNKMGRVSRYLWGRNLSFRLIHEIIHPTWSDSMVQWLFLPGQRSRSGAIVHDPTQGIHSFNIESVVNIVEGDRLHNH